MLRNIHLQHLHHHPHAHSSATATIAPASTPDANVNAAASAGNSTPRAICASNAPTISPAGFSIYSPNISFEQDYRSNYTYQNAHYVLSAAADATARSGRCSPVPQQTAPAPATAVPTNASTYVGGFRSFPTVTVATDALMAGLQRKGFFVVKSGQQLANAAAAPVPVTVPVQKMGGLVGLAAANNNSAATVNANLRPVQPVQPAPRLQPPPQPQQPQQQPSPMVSKGMVESLHNYSKQQCEEETDRLRRKAAAAMRTTGRYVDDDDEDDDDDDEEEEEEDEEDDEEAEEDAIDCYKPASRQVPQFTAVTNPVKLVSASSDDDELLDVGRDEPDEQMDVDVEHSEPEAEAAIEQPPTAATAEKSAAIVAPEHHARRPMNAFLIFCKRHRGIVREKYPNLENRAITKILGDWWANMAGDEKESFNRLAREYKDAFFSANPTFQWYKLPAPPLRTLVGPRPATSASCSAVCYSDFVAAPSMTGRNADAAVGRFKFADETQMGGLTDLMGSADAERMSRKSAPTPRRRPEVDQKTSDLQAALGDASSFFARTMSTNRTEPFRHYRVVKRKSNPGARNNNNNKPSSSTTSSAGPPAKRSVSESSIVTSPADFERFVQANFKRHEILPEPISSEEEDSAFAQYGGNRRSVIHSVQSASSPTTDNQPDAPLAAVTNTTTDVPPKSARACKGKRYLEFIDTVRVATASAASKRPSVSRSSATAAASSSSSSRPDTDSTADHHPYTIAASRSRPSAAAGRRATAAATKANGATAQLIDTTTNFDLDGKIQRLHALSLDEYLSRKRDTKTAKKKKISTARKPQPQSGQSAGSKKKGAKAAATHAQRQQQQQQLQVQRDELKRVQQHQHFLQLQLQQQQQQQQQRQQQEAETTRMMSAQSAQERRDQLRQSAAVGSQKRKARKESITRRDVLACMAAAEQLERQAAAAASASVAPHSPVSPVSPQPQLASPDLFILAQVAAIITSK